MEPAAKVERTHKLVELVTFYLGDSLYGIDILKVQEINKIKTWTPVPNAQDFVKGILSLRGNIVMMLDLSKKLGLAATTVTDLTRNIIISSADQQCMGFLVDSIGSVTHVPWDQVREPPATVNGGQGRYLEGVFKTDTDLIAILDVDEVFSAMETKTEASLPANV
jgi:purine-binding chemotaxis protein CheW